MVPQVSRMVEPNRRVAGEGPRKQVVGVNFGEQTVYLIINGVEAHVTTLSIDSNFGLSGMGTIREITVHAVITDEMIEAAKNKVSDDEVVKELEAIRDDLS